MFEASTVFQRLKSMATLRGMSTKSSSVSETVDGWWNRCGFGHKWWHEVDDDDDDDDDVD